MMQQVRNPSEHFLFFALELFGIGALVHWLCTKVFASDYMKLSSKTTQCLYFLFSVYEPEASCDSGSSSALGTIPGHSSSSSVKNSLHPVEIEGPEAKISTANAYTAEVDSSL